MGNKKSKNINIDTPKKKGISERIVKRIPAMSTLRAFFLLLISRACSSLFGKRISIKEIRKYPTKKGKRKLKR